MRQMEQNVPSQREENSLNTKKSNHLKPMKTGTP